MGKFVHLHTHSHYSLLDGLAKVPQLVERTKKLGMDSLAITDHGVIYGLVEFYKYAKKNGVKPIMGVEAYIAPKDRFTKEANDRYYHLILLAENQTGWKNLLQLVTKAHLEGYYYKPRMDKDLLREYHEGIIALSSCLGSEIGQAIVNDKFDEAVRVAKEHEDIFGKGNYFLEIQDHPHIPEAVKHREGMVKLSKATGIPLVATQDLHYASPEDSEYHDILLAVQTGNKLTDDDRLSLKVDDFSLTSPETMAEKFKDVPEALENTVKIAERCNVELEMGKTHLPNFPKPPGKTGFDYMKELIEERRPDRFPEEKYNDTVKQRLEYELGVIEKTGFADYFLIVQDLTNWARNHGIAVGPGRGSAAGSLVSYILKITDVNPLDYDLLFERFLNPDRIQMPDIDIDFADTRRDEVLAYARQKYGEDHVAQIITFGTMAARAAVRDAGRAMGLPYGFCDQVAKAIPGGPNIKLKESLEKIPELQDLYKNNPDAHRLLEAAKHLEGVARHASVHACGTVFSDKPLTEYIALQLAPQDKDAIVTQFEMHGIEDLGLLKIDMLGLRNLTIIEETIRLVKDLQNIDIKISDLPLDDEKTYDLLKKGDTTGVFQFESSGMRRYMKEIKPNRLEDLIALVALYRPGPMELIPTFIKRKHGQEEIKYLHPAMAPILENTYGIAVYQEQMMRISRELAGYTLAEADTLRKAIGKKIKALLDEQEEKMMSGMIKNGIDKKTATAIWNLYPPFAKYGFNKSHAACYALIGYRTAYLKAHFPEEFMASLLNAEMHDLDRVSFLINESKQADIEVLPPDINKSFMNFSPEGSKIRFGLLAIKNVGEHITRTIIEERTMRGPFNDFEDFLSRIHDKDLNKKSLDSLAKSGALESLGIERNQIIMNMDDILKYQNTTRKNGNGASSQNMLFGAEATRAILKIKEFPAALPADKLIWEKELIGFYISDHPLNAYQEKLKYLRAKTIPEALNIKNEDSFIIGGIISTIKKIIAKNGKEMLFATLEDLSPKNLEAIVFNTVLAKNPVIWKENSPILLQGHMSLKNGDNKFIVDKAQELKK